MAASGEETAPSVEGREGDAVTRLSGAPSAVLGWLAVGAANAAGLALVPLRQGGVAERALHHVYDLGHTLALGLAAAALVLLVARFGPKRSIFRLLLLGALALVAAEALLAEDLGGAAERFTGSDAAGPLRLLCALVSLSVPLASLPALLPATPRVRVPLLLVGVGLVAVNEHVLVNGYPDLHRWIAFTGATWVGASASGLPLGRKLSAAIRWLAPKRRWLALGAVGALALATLAVPPPSSVEAAMLERDTAFLAAPLAELHGPTRSGKARVPRELEPWFLPRAGRKEVLPSAKRPLPPGGIVIVITIDALRADALAPRFRRRLPHFSAMMKRGVTFTEARSFGSGTRVSLAALLTGRYQSMARWTNPESLRRTLEQDNLPRLPELLAPHGVRTVTAVALPRVLAPSIGIVRGFQETKVFDDGETLKGTPEIVDHLLEQLGRQGPGPLFFYTHLLDPHYPYYRHREGPKGPEASYRQEVEYVDGQIGRIRKGIRELGLSERTLLVVSSDHGEGFGEHGVQGHNKALFEVMVHVPLLVEGPGLTPRTVSTRVSMMDIGPTVLDVLGVPTPGWFMGESLVPLLVGEEAKKHRPILMSGPNSEALLFQDGIKVILRGKAKMADVFDLEKDPGEESNLRDTAEGAERAALARAYVKAHTWADGRPPKGIK